MVIHRRKFWWTAILAIEDAQLSEEVATFWNSHTYLDNCQQNFDSDAEKLHFLILIAIKET